MERLLAGLELPAQHRELLRERFDGALDCSRAGEHAVALELVIDNLHEFDVPLSADARAELARLVATHAVDDRRAARLSKLPVSALDRDLEALGCRREPGWRSWALAFLFAMPVVGLFVVAQTVRGWVGTAAFWLAALIVVAVIVTGVRDEARAWREIEDYFDGRDAERDAD